jgi:uncharacterized membrane protein
MLDQQTRTGYVLLAGYDKLRYLYCNGGSNTAELMFLPRYLPPGGSATYTTWVVPVAGLANIVAATPDDGRGNGSLELAVVRSVHAPAALTIDLNIESVPAHQPPTAIGQLTFDQLGDLPRPQQLTFQNVGGDPLVIHATSAAVVAGAVAPRVGQFREYFNGSYQWGENITTDMQTPVYVAPRPPQRIELAKPARLALRRPGQLHCWYVEGLADDAYRILDSLRLTTNLEFSSATRTRATIRQTQFGSELSQFPYDYDELLGYTLLILGDLRADALGPIGMIMLGDYLAAGGGLVMLGGPTAYGRADWAGTPAEEWLPVRIKHGPQHLLDVGQSPIAVAAPGHPVVSDLDFANPPRVRYLHAVEVKPGAEVLLTAGGQPLLVIHEYGPQRARVACWLAPPIGTVTAHNAAGFRDWSDWPDLLRQVFWWALRHDHVFPD